jgi:transposase
MQHVPLFLHYYWETNGVTEGQIHRLKLVKRQGYGRAGFALLRQRVLQAA